MVFRAAKRYTNNGSLAGDQRLERGGRMRRRPCVRYRRGAREFVEWRGWTARVWMKGGGREVCHEVVMELAPLYCARLVERLTPCTVMMRWGGNEA